MVNSSLKRTSTYTENLLIIFLLLISGLILVPQTGFADDKKYEWLVDIYLCDEDGKSTKLLFEDWQIVTCAFSMTDPLFALYCIGKELKIQRGLEKDVCFRNPRLTLAR